MNIAVLGYGTVGSGVVEVLTTNRETITKRAGEAIDVKYVLDLRDFPGDPIQEKIVHDYQVILDDLWVKVEQFRSTHILQLFEYAHGLAHIIAVERSEVAYVHTLKDILLMRERRLQGVVKAYDALATVVVEVAHGVQPLRRLVA